MSEAAGAPLFSVRGLRAGFEGATVVSIDGLSLEEGQLTVIVGENGSGKTTLLRLLNGHLSPFAGAMEYRGRSLSTEGRHVMRRECVMVHQTPLLFRGTVLQNVGYGLRIRGMHRDEVERRSGRALSRVGLAGFERRRASSLSGGEKQRAAIARALVLEPKVLLLDEPTANVDPDSRHVVEDVIRETAAGATVILSTHAMELAYRLCDRLVRMDAGCVVPNRENILKGSVERTDEQFTRFRTGQAVLLCPARQGDFRVAVLPMDEVILSREPLDSSARNRLRGRVTAIEPEAGLLRVTVDCGAPLRALITTSAAADIGVEMGTDVVVTFKASAVRLY
jgi:molybdopterin-binding protein